MTISTSLTKIKESRHNTAGTEQFLTMWTSKENKRICTPNSDNAQEMNQFLKKLQTTTTQAMWNYLNNVTNIKEIELIILKQKISRPNDFASEF